jgi:cytochrome c peroxidase
LESAVEHGADRTQIARLVALNYRDAYGSVFGPLPALGALPDHAGPHGDSEAQTAWQNLEAAQRDNIDRIFANVGKAIAAFERTIVPERTRFDLYADAVSVGTDTAGLLSEAETQGLGLFIGKGECTKCHNGPLMTDNYFHNTGVPPVAGLPDDSGRAAAIEQVIADPFNCLGTYSDAGPGDCTELAYIDKSGDGMVRAYKPPSLRGVAERPPYMHAGQIGTLREVLQHYEVAPAAVAGHSELSHLDMTEDELAALEAFLNALEPISNAGAVP